jgi:hypothetical protein
MPCYIDGVLFKRGVHELPKEKAPKWAVALDAKSAKEEEAKAKPKPSQKKPVAMSEMTKASGGKSFVEAMAADKRK